MLPDFSFQSYLDFIVSHGAQAEELIDIPKEYPGLIQAGLDYESLQLHPGWKRLLDDLEARADTRLSAMRQSLSLDPVVIKALRDHWVEAEESLKFIQVQAKTAVDRRLAIVNELGMKFSGSLDMDDGDAMRISKFMGIGIDPIVDGEDLNDDQGQGNGAFDSFNQYHNKE